MLARFHTKVKRYLIQKYSFEGASALNLTLGSDENPKVWIKSKIKKLVGIDANRARVAVAKSRCSDLYTNPNIKSSTLYDRDIHTKKDIKLITSIIYHHFDPKEPIFVNDKSKLSCIQNKHQFDLATVFFDLERFFEREVHFNNLIINASDTLKIGGYLILTGFSGERINEVMARTKLIRGKNRGNVLWVIECNYSGDFNLNKANFGKSIKMSYYGSYGFKKKMLVNIDYIVHFATLYGFELVEQTPFECFYNELDHGVIMCQGERELSFYNDCVVLKKVKN